MLSEYVHVGRVYRVKIGKKLIDLRLISVHIVGGGESPLKKLELKAGGFWLWMMDERIGKGYQIKVFSQIQEELKEKPQPDSLVQIVKGTMVKTLGSVTVYRVKEVGRDAKSGSETVTIYGPFKNYVLWMDDVRVCEGKKVDPETLLSKESKKIGDMPRKFLPPPPEPSKRLVAFLQPGITYGTLSGEERVTEEEKQKAKLQAELDKKKEEYQEMQLPSLAKKTPKMSKAERMADTSMLPIARQILADAKKPKIPVRDAQTDGAAAMLEEYEEEQLGSRKSKVKRKKISEMVHETMEGEDSKCPTVGQTGETSVTVTQSSPDSLRTAHQIDDEEDTHLEAGEIPPHLEDVDIPLEGARIKEEYFKEVIPASKKRIKALKQKK